MLKFWFNIKICVRHAVIFMLLLFKDGTYYFRKFTPSRVNRHLYIQLLSHGRLLWLHNCINASVGKRMTKSFHCISIPKLLIRFNFRFSCCTSNRWRHKYFNFNTNIKFNLKWFEWKFIRNTQLKRKLVMKKTCATITKCVCMSTSTFVERLMLLSVRKQLVCAFCLSLPLR